MCGFLVTRISVARFDDPSKYSRVFTQRGRCVCGLAWLTLRWAYGCLIEVSPQRFLARQYLRRSRWDGCNRSEVATSRVVADGGQCYDKLHVGYEGCGMTERGTLIG